MTDEARGERKRVLLVEDDERLARLVSEYLEGEGYAVTIEARGDRAADTLSQVSPDIVLLDVMLPGKSGFDVCRELRPRFSGPIALLTAKGEDIDQIVGLELGADDYLVKPIAPRVLLARIRSLLARTARLPTEATQRTVGSLHVNAARREVSVDGDPVVLTTVEFDLLWLLARHAGHTLDRERLCWELRGVHYDGLDRSIDLCVSRVRKKLPDPDVIKSVRGVGYMLVAGAE